MKRAVTVNQQAINAMLPDIPEPFDARMHAMLRELPGDRKETVMKKKLSVGLIFAIILALLAVGALAAALLGGKEFVDSILAPKATETSSDKWTQAEMQEILRIAEENGIELDADTRQRLAHAEGQYKDEVMRLFAKTELGFYPSAWSLEDQKWYGDLLVATGQLDVNNLTVPQPGEMTREEAVAFAKDYIQTTWGANPDLDNPELYLRHQQYSVYKNSEHDQGKMWYVEYAALDATHDSYFVTFTKEGGVRDSQRTAGVGEDATAINVLDRFRDLYGGMYDWSAQAWNEFKASLANVKDLTDETGRRWAVDILSQDYPEPDNEMIDEATAVDIARGHIAGMGYTVEGGDNAMLLRDDSHTVWKALLRLEMPEDYEVGDPLFALCEVDAQTGEVTAARVMGVDEHRWADNYVMESNLTPRAQTAKVDPSPTRRPDGKPGMWYSDRAPQYFWDKMDELYARYTADSDAVMNGWYAQYGHDMAFWDVEARAFYALMHELSSLDKPYVVSFPGLPDETDMPKEQALALAKDASSLENKDAYIVSATFFYHELYEGSHTWQITFHYHADNGELVPAEMIVVDAKTGEIDLNQNG